MNDLVLISNGRVIDPATGTDDRIDLLISGDRIVERQEDLTAAVPARTIDATGLLVLPGFIDAHTHSDFTLATHPHASARVHQGVTTDVTGNCGFSPFPLHPDSAEYGSFFSDGKVEVHDGLPEFAAHIDQAGPAINIAPLVGLGTVRTQVMGTTARPASKTERSRMQRLLARALDTGAFGVSTGLVYGPGRDTEAGEIAEILAPLAGSDRIYSTHIRDERDGVVEATAEAIATAERVPVDLQISHHKALGRANWGRISQTLALVDQANTRDAINVTLDYYPYTAGSTGLSSLLPPDALRAGWSTFRTAVQDPGLRAAVLDHVRTTAQVRPDEVVLGQSRSLPEASGKPIAVLARQRSIEPEEIILSLIEAEGERLTMIIPAASQVDLDAVSNHPSAMHGSDAWLMTKERAQYEHPRNLTSTIRLLESALGGDRSLPGVVDQLSAFPARRFRIPDRGTLAPGGFADVVIADPNRAGRLAEHESAFDYPDLIRWVLVNGQVVLADGRLTGVRPGRVLRRSS